MQENQWTSSSFLAVSEFIQVDCDTIWLKSLFVSTDILQQCLFEFLTAA